MYKRFVLYYREKGEELCGSDSFLPIDGRWSTNTSISYARDIAKKRNLNNNCKYFRICSGTILNPNFLTDYISID